MNSEEGNIIEGRGEAMLKQGIEDIIKIEKLTQWIQESRYMVFFGGAGVSTESGIPDFRSKDGLYRQHYEDPPEQIISHSYYLHKPESFFRFYKENMLHLDAKPNAAHKLLARLEEMGICKAVITQNIDGLHQKAGSKNVIELHGSVYRNYCEKCGRLYDGKWMKNTKEIPYCEDAQCKGRVKPDVVLYEEALNQKTIEDAIEEIKKADLVIIGGTSLSVYPAAGLVEYFSGDRLVSINKDLVTSRKNQLGIQGSIGEVCLAVRELMERKKSDEHTGWGST